MLRQDNNMYSRAKDLEEINKISFSIDELRLYLDTHPNCREALEMIKQYMKMRKELLDSFTEKYGPLDAYSINDSDKWLWNAGYMPWENGNGGNC